MKTVFKRLISSLLLVVMLVAYIPAAIVSAGADDIDWEALKDKYGLTDEQIDAAKDIADEYDLTQEQVDAVEDYYESLPPEEQEELKVTVKDAVEKGEMPELGTVGGDVATNMVKAMFIATIKKAARDVLNRVLDVMEDVTVTNVFGFDRVYEGGSLAGINFVLKSPEDLDVMDTVRLLADRYSALEALALVAGAVLMFDEVSVNGYTVYDLADPSEIRNALVEIYRANPIEFNTIATMEGNVVATYNFSLAAGGLSIDLPVSFVLECSDARLNQIKSTAKKIADRVEVNGDFSEEDGIFSADLAGILDVSDYTDDVLEIFLPAVLAEEYALVREQLHAMTLNDFINQLKLENLEIVADKLGYSAQFDALVAKVAAFFHLDTAEPNDLKALINLIDAKGLFPLYVKSLLQKTDNALQLSEKLNVTVGSLYNGDGSYTFTLGNGIAPMGFDSFMDRVFNKLLNNKYEDRIANALKVRGYKTAEDLVNALKARYNKIYTGKYDLDVSFTLVLFKTYTVTFKDENGNVLSTQKVVAGDGAADPVYHGGSVLNINYSTDVSYDKVMKNLVVTLTPIHDLKVEIDPEAGCLTGGVKTTYCTVAGCDYKVVEDIPAHGHDYEAVVTDPDCYNDGYTTYTCTICGDSYKDNYVAGGHDWTAWTTIPATHVKDGKQVRRCNVCGLVETKIIPAEGHTYETVVTPPTCTEVGYTTYTCSCGSTYKDNYVPALGHDYVGVVTPPTCTEDGYTTYTCSRCGDSYVDNIVPALGHDYEVTASKAATHDDEGYITYTCTRCGDSNTDVIPATGHTYTEVVTPPTCLDEGYTTYTCSCGKTYTGNTVSALGHDYVGVVTPPTCTEKGYTTNTCTRCGDSYKDNYVLELGHDYVGVVTPPTCTEEGYTTNTCTRCGDSYKDNIVAALGHDYVGVVTDPTCTKDGYTTYTCSRCGDSYVGNIVAALGHDYVGVVTDPTCTKDGYTTYTCSRCGDSYVDNIVAALGHDYVVTASKAANCTEDGYTIYTCTRCGDSYKDIIPAAHKYIVLVIDPTCTKEGCTAYFCTVCGSGYIDNLVAPLGHDYVGVVTDPTCTKDGYTTFTCSRCGDTYVGDYVSALGHDYNGTPIIKNPTCLEDGYKLTPCTRCDMHRLEVLYARGYHVFGAWIVDTEATENTNGSMHRECVDCGCIETEVIPATGAHTFVKIYWTDATCTEAGYWTYECTDCGITYIESYGSALGHKYHYTYIAATCTDAGMVITTCDRGCGYHDVMITDPATGHNYDSGVVVVAPTCQNSGLKQYTCSNCGDFYYEYLPVVDHLYAVLDVVDPTCEDDGYVVIECKYGCGSVHYLFVLPAIGHDYVEIDRVDNTCGTDGYVTYYCNNCGHTYTEILYATGNHNYEFVDVIHQPTCAYPGLDLYECTVCGELMEFYTDPDYNAHGFECEIIEPDCENDGLMTHTCIYCGLIEETVIPALDHAWDVLNGQYVAPTCTTEGSWIFDCARCGDDLVVTIPVSAHVYTTVTTQGTSCCDPSREVEICINCGAEGKETLTPVYRPTINQVTTNVAFIPSTDGKGYVLVKADKMTVGEFKTNFYGGITVYNKKGEKLFDSEYIGTASYIICDGCDSKFVISVVGDVNGDGKLSSLDYMYVKRVVFNKDALYGAMLAAADVNVDCKINSIDYAMLKKHLMYRYDIYENLPTWEEIEKNGLVTDDIRG